MNAFPQRVQAARRGAGAAAILFVSLAVLGGCSDILDVDLPAQLGDEALEDPAGAQSQINTFIGHFENAHNRFLIETWGREIIGEPLTAGSYDHPLYQIQTTVDDDYFPSMMMARRFAFLLHDRLVEDWTVEDVPERAQFLAISSIYAGAVLSWMGSSLCESAVDGGPLLTSDQTLDLAETWLTQAIGEIGGADFSMPHGVASSALEMAYGLRAQVRWMAGDLPGAGLDASQVDNGFNAYITRDTDAGRRNRAWELAPFGGSMKMYDVVDWWEGPPNPATGQAWPSPIPFTGWQNLAILPDGRAVREDGLPIRTEGPYTTAEEQADAIRDPRVQSLLRDARAGSQPIVPVVNRYTDADSDIPLVNWREMQLIRAESELGQGAIDRINEMRTFDNLENGWDLPMVMYAPATDQEIRYMIYEERRRALFSEGRFTYTKFQNPELFWFPRNVGVLIDFGSPFLGGVRWLMPDDEFELNQNLTLEDRATGCPEHQRPVQF